MDDARMTALAREIVDGVLTAVEGHGYFVGRRPKSKLKLRPVLSGDDLLPASGVMEAWVKARIAEAVKENGSC